MSIAVEDRGSRRHWILRSVQTLATIVRHPAAAFTRFSEPVDHGTVLQFLATLRLPPWIVLVLVLVVHHVREQTSDAELVLETPRAIYTVLDPDLVQALSTWLLVMVPVGVPLLYFVSGLLAHIGIALTGGAQRSIGATMRAVGYTLGPPLLAISLLELPLHFGLLTGWVYLSALAVIVFVFLVLSAFALARTHRVSLVRGILVALIPSLTLGAVTYGRAALELPTVPPFLLDPPSPFGWP